LTYFRALQVTALHDVAERRIRSVFLDPRVDGLEQLRAVLPDRQGDLSAGAKCGFLVDADIREDLTPEVCNKIVDHRRVHEPGVHHLEQVVVFERLRRDFDRRRRLATADQRLVEFLHALVEDTATPHEHAAA